MKVRYLVCATLLGLVPILASAGEEANAPTVTGETGLFSLLTGETLPRGGWSFGIYANNYDRVLKAGLPGKVGDLDWNRYSASIGVGITDRWEVSAALPYDDFQFHKDPRVNQLNQTGEGNLRVGTKLRLFGNPGDDNKFAINGFVELPTGKKEVASDGTGWGVGLDWSAHNWVFDVGYRRTGLIEGGDQRDLAQTALAIETVRALLPVLEQVLDSASMTTLRGALSELQLAYADAAERPAQAASQEPPPPKPAGPAQPPPAAGGPVAPERPRIWTPGGDV